tara:strand:- start:203 stop:388 length:186 start_codon:yes stop_codon:yes gene_type:complete
MMGIVSKLLNKIVSGRIDKAIDLFANDPKILRSLKTIKREKENVEKALKKHPSLSKLDDRM